jgi:hypothetical protein
LHRPIFGHTFDRLITMHWVVGISITLSGLSDKNSANAFSTPVKTE